MGMKARNGRVTVTLMALPTDIEDVPGWPAGTDGAPLWVQVKGKLSEGMWESAGFTTIPGPDGKVPRHAVDDLKASFEEDYEEEIETDEECEDGECDMVSVPVFHWRIDP